MLDGSRIPGTRFLGPSLGLFEWGSVWTSGIEIIRRGP